MKMRSVVVEDLMVRGLELTFGLCKPATDILNNQVLNKLENSLTLHVFLILGNHTICHKVPDAKFKELDSVRIPTMLMFSLSRK